MMVCRSDFSRELLPFAAEVAPTDSPDKSLWPLRLCGESTKAFLRAFASPRSIKSPLRLEPINSYEQV